MNRLLLLPMVFLFLGHVSPAQENGEEPGLCTPQTVGQHCVLNNEVEEGEEKPLGLCVWPQFHFLPSCLPVLECTPETLGLSCHKGTEFGKCVWRQFHLLPDCE